MRGPQAWHTKFEINFSSVCYTETFMPNLLFAACTVARTCLYLVGFGLWTISIVERQKNLHICGFIKFSTCTWFSAAPPVAEQWSLPGVPHIVEWERSPTCQGWSIKTAAKHFLQRAPFCAAVRLRRGRGNVKSVINVILFAWGVNAAIGLCLRPSEGEGGRTPLQNRRKVQRKSCKCHNPSDVSASSPSSTE